MTLNRILNNHFALPGLIMLLLGSAIIGLLGGIFHQRTIHLHQARERNALHARAFEEHLTRTLDTIAQLPDLIDLQANAHETGLLFRRALSHAPYIRSLSLMDTKGRIVLSSEPRNRGLAIDLRSFSPQVPDSPGAYLLIGRPWAGRDFHEGVEASLASPVPAQGLSFIPAISFKGRDGKELRILAALNPEYFSSYYVQWLPPEQGTTELLRYDRTLLVSSAAVPLTGDHSPDAQLAPHLQEAEIGAYQSMGQDNEEVLIAYRASRTFPLVVVTRLSQAAALAQWRKESLWLLVLAIPALAGLVSLVTAVFYRERRQAEEREAAQRRAYECLTATVFETVLEAVMVSDANGRIVAVNPAFSRITGYSAEEATGAELAILDIPHPSENLTADGEPVPGRMDHGEGEVRKRRKNGELFVAWQSVNQVHDEAGKLVHQVTGLTDITAYHHKAERIYHMAHHDLLTGLPNRITLFERLEQGILQAQAEQRPLTLLFFDLDKFKPVNDSLGHLVGDRLLQQLATRLRQELRTADTLARLGGDEFVILPHFSRTHRPEIVAEKIRRAAAKPFLIDKHLLNITVSIGIATYPTDASDGKELLRHADAAMYQAKTAGGNQFVRYLATEVASAAKTAPLCDFEALPMPPHHLPSSPHSTPGSFQPEQK